MNAASSQIKVAVLDGLTVVKVSGRANMGVSPQFKQLLLGLHERGPRRIALELSECQLMDSTFSGVLAGLAEKFSGGSVAAKPICLISPNAKVIDLLGSLGVEELFEIHTGAELAQEQFKPVEPLAPTSKAEMTRTCLEAHQLLCALNPANVNKFKDVTAFLAEDLKRIEAGAQ